MILRLFLLLAFASFSARAGNDFYFADLRKAANMGFADPVAGDGQGGWTDQGPESDFDFFPVGERTFLGVPFRVLDPERNGGRAIVVLKSRRRPSFPEQVEIPLPKKKVASIYFLHACGWPATGPKTTVASYEIFYADKEKVEIPLRVGVEIGGWWEPAELPAARVGYATPYKSARVGVYLFPWKNPHPDRPVEKLIFKSFAKTPLPILIAVTLSEQEVRLSPAEVHGVFSETKNWRKVDAVPFGVFKNLSWTTAGEKHFGVSLAWENMERVPEDIFERWRSFGADAVRLEAKQEFSIHRSGEVWFWDSPDRRSGLDRFIEKGIENRFFLDMAFWEKASGEKENLEKAWSDFWFSGEKPLAEAENIIASGYPQNLDAASWQKLQDARKLKKLPPLRKSSPSEAFINLREGSLLSTGAFELPAKPFLLRPREWVFAGKVFPFSKESMEPEVSGWVWPAEGAGAAAVLTPALAALFGWKNFFIGTWEEAPYAAPFAFGREAARGAEAVAFFPLAAAAFRRGDIASSSNPAGEKLFSEGIGRSSTKQIFWDGRIGVFEVNAPRFQAVGGFLAHRRVGEGWFSAEVENPHATVLAALALDDAPLSESRRVLLAAAGRMENTKQVWGKLWRMLLQAGQAPPLAEPVRARVFLPARPGNYRAVVLAEDGKPLRKLSIQREKEQVFFFWPADRFYVLIEK